MRKKSRIMIVTIGLMFIALQVSALTVSPMVVLNEKKHFTVENQTDRKARVKIDPADWKFNPKGEVIAGRYGSLAYSLDFDFYPKEFTLEPGEEKRVMIEPAENRPPATTKSSLLMVQEVAVDQEDLKVSFARFVRAFYFPRTSERKKRAEVVGFEKTEKGFSVNVKNTGNMPFKTKGENDRRVLSYVKVQNTSGEVVKEKKIGSSIAIMPGMTRTIEIKVDLEPGIYNVLAVVDYGGEKRAGAQRPFEINN